MNKIWTFIILFSILSILTLVVDSIGYESTGVTVVENGIRVSNSSVRSLFATYGRLMIFRIDGVPMLFTVLIIYPITMGLVFIFLELIIEFLKVIAEAIPF